MLSLLLAPSDAVSAAVGVHNDIPFTRNVTAAAVDTVVSMCSVVHLQLFVSDGI